MSKPNNTKDLVNEASQTQAAVELIKLGARMQMLNQLCELPNERIMRIYKEVKRTPPPRGMLPFSTDWFMTWQQNIHSTLFLNIYNFLFTNAGLDECSALIRGYKLYLEQVGDPGLSLAENVDSVVLPITRAWMLLKFYRSKQLVLIECSDCKSHMLEHSDGTFKGRRCAICNPPSRAKRIRTPVEAKVEQFA